MIAAHRPRFRLRMILAGSFLAALLGAADAARCSDNLVFVPLKPCRVIDTRVSGAGGPLVAGKPRSFVFRGPRRNYQEPAPFPDQGGRTTGCGIPDLAGAGASGGGNRENAARAVAITVELDTGAREVKAWPANRRESKAGALGRLADAEPEIVTMCDEVAIAPCAGGDITFQAAARRHLVVNVVGYFRARAAAPAATAGVAGGGKQALAPRAAGVSKEDEDLARLRQIARLGVTVYYPRTVPERFELAAARAQLAGDGQYVEYELKYCDRKDLCFSIESAYGEIGDEWNDRALSGESPVFGPFRVYVFLPREEGNDTPDTYYLSDWLVEKRLGKKDRKAWPKDGRYYHLLGSGLRDREAVTVIESLAALR